ncbi:MAG: RluA family pseudouridine synthase [Candidatus Nomurabacteria bacterium]|nr:RluA family pseudouridine synthase [Candidatus Nomurabacteria bacterium]
MRIKVLYEDKDILAIDKPSGILVHPDQKSEDKTILDLFVKKYPKIEIVHRLDRETSGVMLLAKNAKAHEFLKKQFMDRTIKKTYYAIVSGWVKNDHDTINKPIGRSPSDFRRHLAGRGVRGELREAITEYKVLKRFTSPQPSPYKGEGEKFTFLEIHPKTGRTHQIRVHMKFINHPVVCDSLYNPNGPCPKGLKRMALHAESIEFKNLKGKIIKIKSPLPKEFQKVVKLQK